MEWDDSKTKEKCWECGKQFSELTTLISHYKSHNNKATCHICKVNFRRLTSLSMHLDNVHLPARCEKCHEGFSSVWELNTHAEASCLGFKKTPSLLSSVIHPSQNRDNFPNETAQQITKLGLWDSLSKSRPKQRIEMKPEMAGKHENSIEYTMVEDDENIEIDCENAEDSSSTTSDEEVKTHFNPSELCPEDLESDGDSSSTDCSSGSSHSLDSKSMCEACGRGPYRSMKLHLLHCSGIKVQYPCTVCKKLCKSEAYLKEHHMPLYSCAVCGQVFPHENSLQHFQCPKGTKLDLLLFCVDSMPQVCKICKSFFRSEESLLNHITRVHTSVVSTKVCIITDASALTDKKVSLGGTQAISSQHAVHQVNGKFCDVQTRAGFLYAIPSSLLTSSSSSSTGKPLSTHVFVPLGATAASHPVSPPSTTIVGLFKNNSQDIALKKRMTKGWRSKASYPCRQCGAILRQPSFIISHRYLHRGPRSHRCPCGRAFKHRLHLLRHCVQHAETVSYICVGCGDTFTGAKLLAEHMKGKSQKSHRSGRTRKCKVKKKCRLPFTCDCGQLFFRPSAYIWHQIKNRRKAKRLKKPVK